MTDVTVLDYRPDPTLDAELAELVGVAVAGWPDSHHLTAELVRSMLRPIGLTATTLALHRDVSGVLRAAAAVQWPAALEASGCLWGPMVHPAATGAGLATRVLAAVADAMAAHPGVRVTTTEIPETRTAGWSLFERAGWLPAGTARLMKLSLPARPAPATSVSVRAMRPGEYLDQALATLMAAARPELGYATARDTYARWASDARYRPEGLLLAEGADVLLGAALVYPSTPAGAQQPVEAVLADLVTASHLDPLLAAAVRSALVGAALSAATAAGASLARAVVDSPALAATLQSAGFEVIEHYRYYTYASPAHQFAALAGSGARLSG